MDAGTAETSASQATNEYVIDVPGGVVQARIHRTVAAHPSTPLLFLHGGPGGSCAGFAAFEALTDRCDVVMFDQLGSPTSSWVGDPTALWTIDRFCAEIDAIRAALRLDRVVLFGHSWGGCLGIEYLCRRPVGVSGIVLANTTASFASFRSSIARRVGSMETNLREDIALAPRSVDVNDAGATYRDAAVEFYRRFVVRNVVGDVAADVVARQGSTEVFRWMQGADELHADGSLATWDRAGDLGSIVVPTLVIGGRWDHMDDQCIDEIVQRIPDARTVTFEDSSHCPHLEQPDDVVAAVRSWLAGLTSAQLTPRRTRPQLRSGQQSR